MKGFPYRGTVALAIVGTLSLAIQATVADPDAKACLDAKARVASALRSDIDPLIVSYANRVFSKTDITETRLAAIREAGKFAASCAINARLADPRTPLKGSPLYEASHKLFLIEPYLSSLRIPECGNECVDSLMDMVKGEREQIRHMLGI